MIGRWGGRASDKAAERDGVPPDNGTDEWSEEARKAAAEARRAKSKSSGNYKGVFSASENATPEHKAYIERMNKQHEEMTRGARAKQGSFPTNELRAAIRTNDPSKVKKFLRFTPSNAEESDLIDQATELWQSR